jgi:hypothetical protein
MGTLTTHSLPAIASMRQGRPTQFVTLAGNIGRLTRQPGDVRETVPGLHELVRLKVDVIVTHNTPGPLAAKQATSTIPIVLATGVVAIHL